MTHFSLDLVLQNSLHVQVVEDLVHEGWLTLFNSLHLLRQLIDLLLLQTFRKSYLLELIDKLLPLTFLCIALFDYLGDLTPHLARPLHLFIGCVTVDKLGDSSRA